ncbi:hypothetical protein B296_00050626 [Ensete ventricosum]|uniref:Uncharacterized protein n=1 Tax=Ensete ventricosum TaxID=4639 RepID=A0A426YKA2_ENSVE|nr:hypothetical protein B296_00050626 [Ensete ventricosum]
MLTSIASAFVGLVSIASNAAINGDLCLLRPHCTVTSQVRSLFFFLFLFLSSSSATSSSSLVLSPSSAIPSSSPFFLPLRNTGSINLLCWYISIDPVLEADLAILDEIDSGLDVDALQDVANAVNGLLTPNNSVLIITHYQRLLDYINPSYVHIMVGASYLIRITVKEKLIYSRCLFCLFHFQEEGMIVKTGDVSLAEQLEREGYRGISMSQS